MTTEKRDCFFSKTSSGSHPNENVAPSAQFYKTSWPARFFNSSLRPAGVKTTFIQSKREHRIFYRYSRWLYLFRVINTEENFFIKHIRCYLKCSTWNILYCLLLIFRSRITDYACKNRNIVFVGNVVEERSVNCNFKRA